MLATGRQDAAAQAYLQLAKLYPKSSALYQLRAAAAYLEAGQISAAMRLLEAAAVDADKHEAAALKSIVLAQLALKNAQAKAALKQLDQPFPPEVSDELCARRHLVRAKAHAALNDDLNVVRERLRLHDYLPPDRAGRENLEEIWSALNSIKPQRLQRLRTDSEGLMRSWIELALINQTHLFKPDVLKQSLDSWQVQYPLHPAQPVITRQMLELSKQYDLRPQKVAVLLPSSGPYQKAAQAIRDGFLTAWYASSDYQPDIHFYNADSLSIHTHYQKAIDNGADFIVGPLEKQAIQSLAKSGAITVPTLALNQVDNLTGKGGEKLDTALPNLIQFGLSPEDESRQIAQRGIFDGHSKALVITPDSDWGIRLYRAFREEWQSLGGTVLRHLSYPPDTKDYRTPIKKLLSIDSSERRLRMLRARLGRRLISEGRRRKDADMIFMVATPIAARQLAPQLRFFRADDIAVYTSSHAYGGKTEPRADNDMNGVIFPDMPWLLDRTQTSSSLQQTLNRYWSANTSAYRRFYALGIDAFQIIPQLVRLTLQQHSTYPGKTGELYMSDTEHLLRKLLWAKFANGKAVLLDEGQRIE